MLKKVFPAGAMFLLLLFSPGPGSGEETHESLFTRYFEGKVNAGSVLSVLSADEESLRRGNIPSLTVCIENAVVEGVTYDRLLLVLTDVYFTVDGEEPGSFLFREPPFGEYPEKGFSRRPEEEHAPLRGLGT